jgi:hypothetical protein
MRDALWYAACSKLSEGEILPWWAQAIRALLYPLDTFYWRMNRTSGYQVQHDAWIIHGVWFSSKTLSQLAHSQGEIYRVTRVGGTVVLETLPPGRVREAFVLNLAKNALVDHLEMKR